MNIQDVMDAAKFQPSEQSALTKDTLYRMVVEASRFWLIEYYLRTGKLPQETTFFAYANGPNGFAWGNPTGPDDGEKIRILRGKRVRITLSVEND